MTSGPAAPQRLCDLARLRRVRDRIDREVTAAGATGKEPPRDVGGGRLVATPRTPAGTSSDLPQDP